MRTPTRKDGERGFALLIVFLMAAAVALVLYQQMPRVAFESEREKEQLLQDRGHEYIRAIQLYYIAFKKYPSKLEDLENTNNKRFLRRRYIDPMTGKDEWRLIHVNVAGQLTDSVVQKPPASPTANNTSNNQDPNNPSTASGTGAGSGTGTGTDAPPAVNAAVLRRPSDNTLAPPGGIGAPGVDPNDPRFWPPATTWQPNQTNGQPGTAQFPGQQFAGQQFPGQQFPGQQIQGQLQLQAQQLFQAQQQIQGQPFQQFPGQQQSPGQMAGSLPGGFQPGFPGQLPFQPGQFQPGTNQFQPATNSFGQGNGMINGVPVQGGIQPGGLIAQFPQGNSQSGNGGSVTDALGAINNALRTPQQTQVGNINAIGAGGLVGVASTYTAPSIKIYKDRQKYNEWEFIFDLKSAMPGQGQNVQPGLGQGAPGSNQNGQPGQNGSNSNGSGSNGSSIFPNGSIFPASGASFTTTNH